ncbi:LpqB family beta-propeller domain-containing protein [Microbacterium sp.]|uniref:LpqB family beta-propeller domain-containing protein n=1 Tax=Microbacterium sp. TaxID=51671 RepID=UPI0039E4313E
MIGRRMLAAAVSALAALALTACAGLPTSGAVNAGDAVADADTTSDFAFIPNGPVEDATPQQIVEGFIAAGSGPSNNWQTAQTFLTPEFTGQWKPQDGVTVYSPGLRTIAEVAEDEFVLTVTPVATVDAAGELTTAGDTGDIRLTFKLEQQADGQWRISQAPDGIVLDRTRFAAVFAASSIMYFDPTWTYLVPDQRWFPRAYAATRIAQALVDGEPSPWLAGSVATAFTDDARLAQAAVPVRSNVAEVTLQDGAGALDQLVLDRMQTQLEASLVGTGGIAGVDMLTVGDQRLAAEAVTVRSTRVDSRPLVLTADAFGFVAGSTIEEIPGLSDAVTGLAANGVVAIETDAERTLAAVRDADGAVLVARADGSTSQLDPRSGLVAPSVDPFGFVWTAPVDDPAGVVAYAADSGAAVQVAGGWPGATQIVAQRVSRDGTQVAAVVRDGEDYSLWVAGIQRDRDHAPVTLGTPKVLAVLPGPAGALTWLDAATLGVLTTDDGEDNLYTHEVGGFGSMLRTPPAATAVAGGSQSGGVRLRDADGELYTKSGANWQHLGSGVLVLAIQQGMPH